MPLFGIVSVVYRFFSDPSSASRRSAFVAATLLCGVSFADDAPIKGSAEFFDQFCSECHYEDQSGGLDLSELTFEPDNRDNFATWVRMFDRLAAGEMPPKKAKKRPAPADLATFTHTVSSSLTAFEK